MLLQLNKMNRETMEKSRLELELLIYLAYGILTVHITVTLKICKSNKRINYIEIQEL